MNMHRMIDEMKQRALGADFIAAVYAEYEAEQDSYFTETESDFQKALAAFENITEEQRALLDLEQDLAEQNRLYAAHYGFVSGIYAGFRQCFVAADSGEEDFNDLVENGLFVVRGMVRHPEFYKRRTQCNDLYSELSASLGSEMEAHVVSLECARGEREHHAAFTAFYYGYRVALDVIGSVSRLQEIEMCRKQIMTEYSLGLTGTYDMIRLRTGVA